MLKRLRVLPLVLLLLLVILFIVNLYSKRRAFSEYLSPSGGPDTLAQLFDAFSVFTCEAFPGDSLGAPCSRFSIEPNERGQRLACAVRCRLARPGPVRLRCTWFRGDGAVTVDRLVLSDRDSLRAIFRTVDRSQAGLWSVDLALEDGKPIRTLVFNVVLVKHPLPYKSLMKEGEEKGGS
jgi:hypothetical protein